MRSPGIDQKGFATELPTMQETREEHEDARKRLEGEQPPEDRKYKYNPQDYVNTQSAQMYPQPLQFSQPPQYAHYNHHGR
jgi:hypothetical protein